MYFPQNDEAANTSNYPNQSRLVQGSMLNKWTSQENRCSTAGLSFTCDSSNDNALNHPSYVGCQQGAMRPFMTQMMPNYSESRINKPNTSQIWSNMMNTASQQNISMNPHFNFHNMPPPILSNQNNAAFQQREFVPAHRPQLLNNFNGRDLQQMPPMPFPHGGPMMAPNFLTQNNSNSSSRLAGGRPFSGQTTPNAHNASNLSNHLMNIGNLPSGTTMTMPNTNFRQQQPIMSDMRIAQFTPQSDDTFSDYNPALYWKEPEDPQKKRQQEMGTHIWGDPKQRNGRPIKLWKDYMEENENRAPLLLIDGRGVDSARASGGWGDDVSEVDVQRSNPIQEFGGNNADNMYQLTNAEKTFNRNNINKGNVGNRREWNDEARIAQNNGNTASYNIRANADQYLFEDELSRLNFGVNSLENELFR